MPKPVSLARSRRLRRLARVLLDAGDAPRTTLDLCRLAHLPDPATCVRELKGWPNDVDVASAPAGRLHIYWLTDAGRARAEALLAEAAAAAPDTHTGDDTP